MNGEKPVSGSDAWDFAASIGAQYIETSSYTQVNYSKRLFLEHIFILAFIFVAGEGERRF